MDLSLVWFTKFNTLFFLERLQEDMLKFIVEESVSGKLWLEPRYLNMKYEINMKNLNINI